MTTHVNSCICTSFYLRIQWIHQFHGICIVFSQNFEKSTVFCSILPMVAVFPFEILEILNMVTYKVTNLLKVALDRVDISKILPEDPPVNHFYLQ